MVTNRQSIKSTPLGFRGLIVPRGDYKPGRLLV